MTYQYPDENNLIPKLVTITVTLAASLPADHVTEASHDIVRATYHVLNGHAQDLDWVTSVQMVALSGILAQEE